MLLVGRGLELSREIQYNKLSARCAEASKRGRDKPTPIRVSMRRESSLVRSMSQFNTARKGKSFCTMTTLTFSPPFKEGNPWKCVLPPARPSPLFSDAIHVTSSVTAFDLWLIHRPDYWRVRVHTHIHKQKGSKMSFAEKVQK